MALKLTDEQAEDFTVLAEALAANKGNNEIIHDIGAKYKDFVSRNWNALVDGVTTDRKLRLKLQLSVKLLASKTE